MDSPTYYPINSYSTIGILVAILVTNVVVYHMYHKLNLKID